MEKSGEASLATNIADADEGIPKEIKGNGEENSKLVFYEPTTELLEEAKRILDDDKTPVKEFWQNKYEQDAKRNWDIFYKNNKDNFFKDRHYINREFKEV